MKKLLAIVVIGSFCMSSLVFANETASATEPGTRSVVMKKAKRGKKGKRARRAAHARKQKRKAESAALADPAATDGAAAPAANH